MCGGRGRIRERLGSVTETGKPLKACFKKKFLLLVDP